MTTREAFDQANFNEDWEREAENWARWVRTPGHDSFDQFNGDEFFKLIPPAGRATIDVGCGEGRISRRLKNNGHNVAGIDASPTLIRMAAKADPEGNYQTANAANMPFENEAFDLAVAHNVLMDVDDMVASLVEISRILIPGGLLCICITHPLNDAGSFQSASEDSPFIIEGSYFGRRRLELTVERDDLTMTFTGWCYSLQDYSRALKQAGFVIEEIREPVPPVEITRQVATLAKWRRIPMFMHLLVRKS